MDTNKPIQLVSSMIDYLHNHKMDSVTNQSSLFFFSDIWSHDPYTENNDAIFLR